MFERESVTEFDQWLDEFIESLIEAGLPPGQAYKYDSGGLLENDAEALWKKGYGMDLCVMHELLGPDTEPFQKALRQHKQKRIAGRPR